MNTFTSSRANSARSPLGMPLRILVLLGAGGLTVFSSLAIQREEPPQPEDQSSEEAAQPADQAPADDQPAREDHHDATPPPPTPPPLPAKGGHENDRPGPLGRGRLWGGPDGMDRAARIRQWMSSEQGKAHAIERLEHIRGEVVNLNLTLDSVISELKAGKTPNLAALRPLLDRPLPSLAEFRERMALEGRGPDDRPGRGPEGRPEGDRPGREGPRDGRGPARGPEGRPILTDEERARLIDFVREARPEFATLLGTMAERQPELVDRWIAQLAPRAIETFELESRDPEMAELRKNELRASIEILDESFQVRQLANVENASKERVDAAKTRLREAIGRGFDARIKVRELETDRLERRVAETREAITKQRGTRDRVVENVLSEMLAPMRPRPERRRPGETLEEEMRRAERDTEADATKPADAPAPKAP